MNEFGTELNYYQIVQIYLLPDNEFDIEVLFIHTQKKREYRVKFIELKMPEGDYCFDSTDYHYGVNPDNSVTFFYKKFDGHFDSIKIDLEPIINAEIEANHCLILY